MSRPAFLSAPVPLPDEQDDIDGLIAAVGLVDDSTDFVPLVGVQLPREWFIMAAWILRKNRGCPVTYQEAAEYLAETFHGYLWEELLDLKNGSHACQKDVK